MGGWRKALACLCVCGAFLSLFMPVYADENVTVPADAVEIENAYADTDGIVLDGFATEGAGGWTPATGLSAVRLHTQEDVSVLQTVPAVPEGGEYTIMRNFPAGEEPNLMAASLVRTQIMVSGNTEKTHTVRIRMYSGMNTWETEAQIQAGKWYTLTADVGEWKYRTTIHMMEITVLNEGEFFGFSLGGVCAGGEADLSIAEKFMTFGFTATGGEAEFRDGVYLLDAGADGNMTLVADAVRPSYETRDGKYALRVVLDHANANGYISLAVADGPVGVASFTIASTVPTYYGENTYLLPYDEDIPLYAYRLSFRGLRADGADSVVLREVSLEYFDPDEVSLGKITECALSADLNTLSVRGTLPNQVVTDHIGGTIGLFEIPVWADEEQTLAGSEPLATIRVSTKFHMSVDMSARKNLSTASRYLLAILTEDGPLPIAPARFADRVGTPSTGYLSVVGLYGAPTADVFEANASSVVVDVFVDRLLGGVEGIGSSGQLFVRGGQYYYLDAAYLKELDRQIRFYAASDMEIYLRLVCATDMSSLQYTQSAAGAEFFAFDTRSEAGVNVLCAVTEYVASRYPSVCGFIAGERLDSSVYNGTALESVAEYAQMCADTMRLIYNSAVTHIPDVFVLAPIGDTEGDTAAGRFDPVLLSVHLADAIRRGGEMPWAMMYISDNSGEMIGKIQNVFAQIRGMDRVVPREFVLMWEPTYDYDADLLLAEYNDRCTAAQKAGARALFLSVAGQKNIGAVCAELKNTVDGSYSTRQLSRLSGMLVDEPTGYYGKYLWCDFTQSYSTLGWLAGSGCDRLISHSGGFTSGVRSLHAVFGADAGEGLGPVQGNILLPNARTENMRFAPYVIYTLQVVTEWESVSAAELVFVFGSGDTRAEYMITVPTGVPVRVLCDLTEFSAAAEINYTAVTVRCDSAASMDIQKIECCSHAYSDGELAELYRHRETRYEVENEIRVRSMSRAQWAVCILIGMGTVTAVALLSRRDKEKE